MLRRRKSTQVLYWRLKRPRAQVYVAALIKVIIYRLVAAILAILAIACSAFVGMAGRNTNYHQLFVIKNKNLSLAKGYTELIYTATVHSLAHLSRWASLFVLLGLIVVAVPRPPRWLFGITMIGGVAVGYYQRRLPPFPVSSIANYMTRRTALMIAKISVSRTSPTLISVLLLAIAILVGYGLYRNSYVLAVRTGDFIPRHPANHYRSTFRAVSIIRRLVAAIVTGGLLISDFYIVENIRVKLPIVRSENILSRGDQISLMGWLIIIAALALMICTPRPNGYRWLMIVLLAAITAYTFLPCRSLLRLPTAIIAPQQSFWLLAAAYMLITGLAYSLVSLLLDWPN